MALKNLKNLIAENLIAENLFLSFKEICTLKNVDPVTEIKYKLITLDDHGTLTFAVVNVPQKMIAPCRHCGLEFNSTNNFTCYKDISGNPFIDACINCAYPDGNVYRRVSLHSILSVDQIRSPEETSLLRICFGKIAKYRQEKLTLKQQQCVFMLIKNPKRKKDNDAAVHVHVNKRTKTQ